MVDIPGVGTVEAMNAASESTLQELVKVMGGNANGGSTGGTSGPSGGGALPTKKVKDFGDEIEGTSTFVEDLGSASQRTAKGLIKFAAGAVSGAVGALTTFGSAVIFGTGRMQEIGAAIPLIGGPLGALGGVLDNTIDGFRSAANVGASFGNDMLGVTKVAAQAGLTVDQFSSVIANSSESLALLGGNVTQGALRFAEVSKSLRTGRLGDRLMNMGFSMEMINEGFINYSEEMARQGRLSGMTNAQLAAGSAAYMEELDELAKTTGKTREELAGMRMQALDDAKINRMASNLEGEQRDNFLNNITQLNAVSPGLRDIFVDLADGVAQTEEAQMLLASSAGQSAMALAQQMKTGELSEAEFNNKLKALGPELDSFFGGMSEAQLAALEQSNPALYTLADSAIQLNRLQEKSVELTKAEQDSQNKLTDFFSSFQQVFVELQGKIRDLFLDSPLFETLSDAFTSILEPVEGTSGIFDKIKPKLEEFMEWINGWVQQFMADPVGTFDEIKENIIQALKDGVKSLFSNFLPSLDTVLVGAVAGVVALITAPIAAPFIAIGAALVAMFGYEKIKEWVGAAWDSITGVFSGISDWWSNLDLSQTFNDAWKGLKSWFGGIFDFDIEMPDFKQYLPSWLGGEGKSFFGSDNEEPVAANQGDSSRYDRMIARQDRRREQMRQAGADENQMSAAQQAALEETNAADQQTASAASPAQSMEQNEAVALNTTMERMIALLEEQNRLSKRTVNAIAESGNLQG